MVHNLPEGRGNKGRRFFGIRWPLVVVAFAFFVTWVVLFGGPLWTNNNPLRLIQSGTAEERQKAALDLGESTDGKDIDAVIASLVAATNDTDVVVRSVAADSLSGVVHRMLRRPPATPEETRKYDERVSLVARTLKRGLSDPDPIVRKTAAYGFGLLGGMRPLDLPPELISALGDQSERVRTAANGALHVAHLTTAVVPNLLEALASSERDIRFNAAEILGRVGPGAEPAVPALLAILNEPFDRERNERTAGAAWQWDPACAAAAALGKISASQHVIDRLIEMLSSDVVERISSAAKGLGTLGPKAISAGPALIMSYERMLASEKNWSAARGLAALGPKAIAAAPALIISYWHMLASEEHWIGQIEIANAIGRIAPHSTSAPRAVAVLVRALDSKDWSIQRGAIDALAKFGPEAAGATSKLHDIERNEEPPHSGNKVAATAALAAIAGNPGPARPELREIP
jgi:HEAT repeat protein